MLKPVFGLLHGLQGVVNELLMVFQDPKSTSAAPSPENSERVRRGHEAPQSRSSSIIETIFSPVFTLFGAKEGAAHSKTVSRVSSQGEHQPAAIV